MSARTERPAPPSLPPLSTTTQPATSAACRQDYATGQGARDALTATVNNPHPGTTAAVTP